MGYCTVKDVRALSGFVARYERDAPLLPKPNGTRKIFYAPSPYIVDSDGDEESGEGSEPYVDDVTVYVDGTEVTVTAVNNEIGRITLDVAPGSGTTVTADYAVSEIPDDQITAIITRVDAQIERFTRTSKDSATQTDYFDGDGSKKRFYFSKWPASSVTTVEVDESDDYTVDEDYYLYQSNDRAFWIEFYTAPSSGNKNVKVEYTYGADSEISYLLEKLSLYMSAREVIMEGTNLSAGGKNTYTGTPLKSVAIASNKALSAVLRIDEEIRRLRAEIGGQVMVG